MTLSSGINKCYTKEEEIREAEKELAQETRIILEENNLKFRKSRD